MFLIVSNTNCISHHKMKRGELCTTVSREKAKEVLFCEDAEYLLREEESKIEDTFF